MEDQRETIKALILEGDHCHKTSSIDEIAAAHAAGNNFWVELDEPGPDSERLLTEILKIHPLAIEDIWNDIGIPKVEDFGDYIQIVMHGVREESIKNKEIPLELAELDIVIGKNFLVTHAHDERACAIAPVLEEVIRNAKLLKKGPAWLAHAIIDRMVDAYLPVVNRFDDNIESAEERILEGKLHEKERVTMRRILRIKRSLQMLRRTCLSQREILLRLARAEFDEIPREAMPFYRDIYDHFTRVTEAVDGYRELAASLLDAHFSIQSQQMNEIMKRLTLISTIMLPLTVIAGVYGMNFKIMPELEWVHGYYFALGLMALVAVVIVGYFKAKRWL